MYPYQSWGQWLKASIALVCCTLLAIFNGWRSFISPFSRPDFIASYISVRKHIFSHTSDQRAKNFEGGRFRPLKHGLPCNARRHLEPLEMEKKGQFGYTKSTTYCGNTPTQGWKAAPTRPRRHIYPWKRKGGASMYLGLDKVEN
jgi:hypothetical protein